MLSLVLLVTATVISQCSGHSVWCTSWRALKCATSHSTILACEELCLRNETNSTECANCFETGPLIELYPECVQCSGAFQAIIGAVAQFDDHGAQGSTCGIFDWLTCNAALVSCASVCLPNATQIRDYRCASCMGDRYGSCAGCQAEIAIPDSTAIADIRDCSPLDWIQCGAIVGDCVDICKDNGGVGSPECIDCLGEAYDRCQDCVEMNRAVDKLNVADHFGCSVTDWVHCTGAFYPCLETCLENGIDSPQCIRCFGAAGDECDCCILSRDKDDFELVQIEQLNRRALLTGSASTNIASGMVVYIAMQLLFWLI